MFNSNGTCVDVDPSNGVCEETNGMIANNNEKICNSEIYFFIISNPAQPH